MIAYTLFEIFTSAGAVGIMAVLLVLILRGVLRLRREVEREVEARKEMMEDRDFWRDGFIRQMSDQERATGMVERLIDHVEYLIKDAG